MEQLMREVASYVALVLEAVAVLLVVVGAIAGAVDVVDASRKRLWVKSPLHRHKEVFLRFASWLVLGLEFELAADIVRTAISPSWNDIGKLASIAVIRTGLNFFLERDLDHFPDGPAPERRSNTPNTSSTPSTSSATTG